MASGGNQASLPSCSSWDSQRQGEKRGDEGRGVASHVGMGHNPRHTHLEQANRAKRPTYQIVCSPASCWDHLQLLTLCFSAQLASSFRLLITSGFTFTLGLSGDEMYFVCSSRAHKECAKYVPIGRDRSKRPRYTEEVDRRNGEMREFLVFTPCNVKLCEPSRCRTLLLAKRQEDLSDPTPLKLRRSDIGGFTLSVVLVTNARRVFRSHE